MSVRLRARQFAGLGRARRWQWPQGMMKLCGRLRNWLGRERANSNGAIPLHARQDDDLLVELPELESDDLMEERDAGADLRAWTEAFDKMTGRDLDPLEDEIATEPNVRS